MKNFRKTNNNFKIHIKKYDIYDKSTKLDKFSIFKKFLFQNYKNIFFLQKYLNNMKKIS